MPRDSNGRYALPPGTYGQPNTTIESARYNRFVDDVTQDLNTPRPITAGGTGATSAEGAIENLGGVSLSYLDDLFAGMCAYFPMASPPDGWLICNGQAVSRASYARLFALIGTDYGVGNGSTTFNVPDMRGEFIRGADLGRGVDDDREVGSFQDQDVKAHTHTGTTNTTGSHTHTYSVLSIVAGSTFGTGANVGLNQIVATSGSSGSHSHTVDIPSSGGTESRPRNIAMVPCIKT